MQFFQTLFSLPSLWENWKSAASLPFHFRSLTSSSPSHLSLTPYPHPSPLTPPPPPPPSSFPSQFFLPWEFSLVHTFYWLKLWQCAQYLMCPENFSLCYVSLDVLSQITVMYVWEFRWRRQTRLRQVGASGGLRGDVYYFAPCGKKLRTYPEVTRVSDLSVWDCLEW